MTKCDIRFGMPAISDPPFAQPASAVNWERRKSASYFWDNSKRGRNRYVILQQTLSGCGRFRFRGRESLVPTGSVLIAMVPERSSYFFCAEDSREWVFRWIDFDGESAVQLWGALRKRFGPVIHLGLDSGAGRTLGRLIDDVADRRFSGLQVQAEAAHAAFLSCWFQLESLEAGTSNPAVLLRELIREKYQHGVNIKQLCAEAGQSREHLSRVFKATYGIEPAAYLRQLRLAAAERFLLRSGLSIREIALRTGHAGPAQFTRSFIAANGKTPRAFRNH